MKTTSIASLIGTWGFCAAASLIVVSSYFGLLSAVPVSVAITLWVMAVLCLILGIRIKSRIEENKIGLDRSQLNPLSAAMFLVIGKASAWTGAIFGGVYTGMGIYVLMQYKQLAAAADEAPVVIAAALGGIAMSVGGAFLERNCSVPPPTDGEPA
ncbi:DUF3180 domain-containing protein [Corynebacterium sp. SCR221107]|uniref:DUF3180 domain-containing protein n=1 Tax=Corynebacterium sp. SCR221107 TaxID=3017361 RepID=UPI0022EC7627|nr:DUF3180 domain-containing protein [Corynebacterium sp. SCR221107]WBT08411.1 DUF3180 domain-containing protein [Corynebacterium sp. SCR221107]